MRVCTGPGKCTEGVVRAQERAQRKEMSYEHYEFEYLPNLWNKAQLLVDQVPLPSGLSMPTCGFRARVKGFGGWIWFGVV